MRKITLILGLFLIVGCGDSEAGSDNKKNGSETGNHDVGQSGEDTETPGNHGETCEPVKVCGSDVCGVVDDGCGGTLECEPCDCVDGVARVEVCGGCDLGVMQCDPGSTGSGICDVPDIPGWSKDSCEGLVFVSPEGTAAGTGDKDSPLDSIVAGVDAAKSKGAVGVIIASGAGNVPYEGRVVIDSQISLIGGYTTQFEKDAGRHSKISSNGDEGLLIKSVSKPILVENIEVKVADATLPGMNNYAVRVFDSEVTFREVRGLAGRGGAGTAGMAGTSGQNGANGTSFGVLKRIITQVNNGPKIMQAVPSAAGGVNEACPDANGGAGGQSYISLTSPQAATPGQDGQSTRGGAAGDYVPAINSASTRGGKNGAHGEAVQSTGRHGTGGIPTGTVDESTGEWVLGAGGESGGPGENGSGGGGGGGGVGHDSEINLVGGSNGGGGGAGGCGGGGGGGGSNGGGSFGLLAVDSELILDSTVFSAGGGGDGGAGGVGGVGGMGGRGGKPHLNYLDGTTEKAFLITGGEGGDGAIGGSGGAGGGGAGGPSYGGYCYRTSVTAVGTNRFIGSSASRGGNSTGIPGPSGESMDSFQCN